VSAVLRGWSHGLRGMPDQRATRTPAERREAVRRLVTLPVAICEHARLQRL
jgi:hypothetical protein